MGLWSCWNELWTSWDYMVHYDRTLALHQPPPICPKCGSHRTHIVGLSTDGKTVAVRCNACGERSEVKITQETTDLASESLPPLSL